MSHIARSGTNVRIGLIDRIYTPLNGWLALYPQIQHGIRRYLRKGFARILQVDGIIIKANEGTVLTKELH